MKTNKENLEEVITSLCEAIKKEREESEPYKELFKSGSTLTGLLRKTDANMVSSALVAVDIMRSKFNIEVNDDQFYAILALPYLIKKAEEDIQRNEGFPCHVDKAYYIVSEWILSLRNKP